MELPLFHIRENARATDPVTSVMAAEAVAPHVAGDRMLALRIFYANPEQSIDDFELAEMTGRKQTSIGKRRGELERLGLVEKADRRRGWSTLTTSIVQSYRITEAGMTFYARETTR